MNHPIRNLPQNRASTADVIMLEILDLYSQGYSLPEACEQAGVDESYWRKHRGTFHAALGATNLAHAVRRAIERKLVRV